MNSSLWKFVKKGKAYYLLNKSGQVLDIYRSKRHNGAKVLSWTKHRRMRNNQRFYYYNRGRGKFLLKNVHSGKCVDNTGRVNIRNGYHQWSCNKRNRNQHLTILKNNHIVLPTDYLMIQSNGNKCVHAKRRRSGITQGPCTPMNSSLWKFVKHGKAYYLENKSGEVLDIYGSKKGNRVKVLSWTKHLSNNQRFYFNRIGRGEKFLLMNVHSGKCVDNTGRVRIGRRYHQYSCIKRNRNQHMKIIKINSGYKKKTNFNLLGGKYKFNFKSGTDFCSKKCIPNRSSNNKVCFKDDKFQTCNSCSFNGNKANDLGKDSDELCKKVCNALDNQNKCEFYTYINNKNKVINKKLLNRFGKTLLEKQLKKMKRLE
jgi:hypothetical protein